MKSRNSKLKDKYYINEKTHLATKNNLIKLIMGEGFLISSGGLNKKRKINKRPFPFIRQWFIQSEIGHNYYTLGKSLEFLLKIF